MTALDDALAALAEQQQWMDTHRHHHSARKSDVKALASALRALIVEHECPITDAQVEAAAKALAETFGEEPHLPWDRWGELSRDEFRADARAALEAARDAS
jgi:hypothetical protein